MTSDKTAEVVNAYYNSWKKRLAKNGRAASAAARRTQNCYFRGSVFSSPKTAPCGSVRIEKRPPG